MYLVSDFFDRELATVLRMEQQIKMCVKILKRCIISIVISLLCPPRIVQGEKNGHFSLDIL